MYNHLFMVYTYTYTVPNKPTKIQILDFRGFHGGGEA